MLQASTEMDDNLLNILSKFSISYQKNLFKVGSESIPSLTAEDLKDLVKIFVKSPKLLRLDCIRSSHIKFSLCAWLVGKTEISSKLVAGMFDAKSKMNLTESHIEDYAYACNYIKRYEPAALNSVSAEIIDFYNHRLDSSSRPLFIKLLPNFLTNFSEEWKEILLSNWRDGRRDMATASLQTLINFNVSNDLFDDLDQFRRIDDIQVLSDVLLAAPANNSIEIFRIYRERLISACEFEANSAKRIKTSNDNNSAKNEWINQWSRVIKTRNNWLTFDSIHPIDLLSKLTLSALNPDKSTFKSFYSAFSESEEEVKISLLAELVPEVLNKNSWLTSILPRPLMNLFAQLLQISTESLKQILLPLCRMFMDCHLGTFSRKSFVNYLASHTEDEGIGEKCLGLIESFVEHFPESRYVCLTLIKSLLEGVDTWEPHLLVQFYSSYALMARTSDSVMNDLILLLKKQIYSSDVIYKRIGARGVGVFLAKNGLADRIKAREQSLLPDPDDTFNDMASCSQKPRETAPVKCDYHLRIIISLLEETVKSLRSDRQSMLIFLKYVNESFDRLDDEIKDWIGDWVRSVFQSSFIAKIDEELFSYKYECDEDNPLSLDLSQSELKECAPVLLSIMGRFELYQNSGNLEGIDALQGCAVQFDREASSSDIFRTDFIALNYFRTVLNVFCDTSRLEVVIELQQQLKDLIRSKPAYLAEFKLFPECHALIQTTTTDRPVSEEISVPEGSFLDELLQEARKPENRLGRTSNFCESKTQLYELNEICFKKSLVPLEISLIEKIIEEQPKFLESIYKEIDFLIEFHYQNDLGAQGRLLDCLLKISVDFTCVIETICKVKRESISNTQKQILLRKCQGILESSNDAILIQSVCKLLVDVLKCPEMISNPMNLLKISLDSSNNFGALKYLIAALSEEELNSLIGQVKNDQITIKNRVILLKGLSSRYSRELKHASIEKCQLILGIWADLIQFIRGCGVMKLLQGIVKESHVILESFLSCDTLKRIESEALLLEGSEDRDSVLLLFKTVQQSTRGLQVICNHLKYAPGNKNTSDPLAIPNLKRSLESVIFRVKELLTRSGCLGAFWMGNLKHRDLEGQEISSQVELLNINAESADEAESVESEDEDELLETKLSESFIQDSDNDMDSYSDIM